MKNRLARIALAAGLLAALPASAGLMGGAPTRVPKPAKDFSAVVEDVGGVRVTVRQLSWDGEVHVIGDLGSAEIAIPFENVVELAVSPASDPRRRSVRVSTRAAEPVTLEAEDDVELQGVTAYGNYRIELADVRKLEFPAAP